MCPCEKKLIISFFHIIEHCFYRLESDSDILGKPAKPSTLENGRSQSFEYLAFQRISHAKCVHR